MDRGPSRPVEFFQLFRPLAIVAIVSPMIALLAGASFSARAGETAPKKDAVAPAMKFPLRFAPVPSEADENSAVHDRLSLLIALQDPDGGFPSCWTRESRLTRAGSTGLAMLALLGAGHTEKTGRYKSQIQAASAFLLRAQGEDGSFTANGLSNAFAVLAVSEGFGMARVKSTGEAAQKAIAQLESCMLLSGGWARTLGDPANQAKVVADLRTTMLGIMCLKSGKVAGLRIQSKSFQTLVTYLDSLQDKKSGKLKPELAGASPWGRGTRRAAAITLGRLFYGWQKDDPEVTEPAKLLDAFGPPRKEDADLLLWYAMTLVQFQRGRVAWSKWNDGMRPLLSTTRFEVVLPAKAVKMTARDAITWEPVIAQLGHDRYQRREDAETRLLKSGERALPLIEKATRSLDPEVKHRATRIHRRLSNRSAADARLYGLALSALCLEVYYRYLPMYR